MSSDALVIFVRTIIPGSVKTRLAKDIGDDDALRIYQRLLAHTHIVTRQVKATRYVYYSDHIVSEDHWNENTYIKCLQHGEDLGQRIAHAIATTLRRHRHVVLIGSDLADLDSELLNSAFDALRNVEVVIGPAADGGYYLIGCNTPYPQLFEGIDWGTDRVFAQTRALLLAHTVNFKILPHRHDIDTIADLAYAKWL